uniref:Uncharacterized protein n=1 Tax=Caulobacter sp. (strain K31) TaxID=366602 RepID=B0T9C5_CAUSK
MVQFEAGQFAKEAATPEGVALWTVLNKDDVIARMETASDLGRPALEPVQDILLEALGEVMMDDRYKQLAGRMVRQILESRGFEHETADVRLNSVPFYKASRYRRVDQAGVYLFKSSVNPREICLSAQRDAAQLPAPTAGRWMYVGFLTSRLKAQIGYQFDLKDMVKRVAKGPVRHTFARMMRPA